MTRKKIIEDETLTKNIEISTWPIVHTSLLSTTDRQIYYCRKTAIDLYIMNSCSLKEIQLKTGIVHVELRRFLRRCLELDNDGNIWGYRALIPGKRIKKFCRKDVIINNRKHNKKLTGAFSQLLEAYPSLEQFLIKSVLKKKKITVSENAINMKFIHKQFLDECRLLGITINNYPFNTISMAKRSVERYINKLEKASLSVTKENSYTDNIDQVLITRPFKRVQFDGHRIDTLMAITFVTPEGDEITNVLDRIWILGIIEVATNAVLGYYLSLNKEYNSFDVLKCIKNAVMPWEPKKLTIPGLSYPEKGGFPSGVIPETQWAAWDELYLDNAKANLSSNVEERLTYSIGCAVNAGRIKNPQRRSLIESFFKILEDNGYHRLPSTTGSSPNDPIRQKPDEKAIKYRITFEHIEELTEILIANYNGTPNEGVNYLTPLEAMQQRVEKGTPLRTVPIEKRSELLFFTIKTQRNVVGSMNNGIRPHINYEGVKYSNEVLVRSPDLVGTKLTLYIDIENIRVMRAFLPDGSELGSLTAVGKWGVVPHSLQIRKEINKLRNKKLIYLTQMDDPIEVYKRYLVSKAKNSKAARNRIVNYERKGNTDLKHENASMDRSIVTKTEQNSDLSDLKENKAIIRKLRNTITF